MIKYFLLTCPVIRNINSCRTDILDIDGRYLLGLSIKEIIPAHVCLSLVLTILKGSFIEDYAFKGLAFDNFRNLLKYMQCDENNVCNMMQYAI